jgi:hypothetical protein
VPKWVTYIPLVDNTEVVPVKAGHTLQGRLVFGDEYFNPVVVSDVECDDLVLRSRFVSADVE